MESVLLLQRLPFASQTSPELHSCCIVPSAIDVTMGKVSGDNRSTCSSPSNSTASDRSQSHTKSPRFFSWSLFSRTLCRDVSVSTPSPLSRSASYSQSSSFSRPDSVHSSHRFTSREQPSPSNSRLPQGGQDQDHDHRRHHCRSSSSRINNVNFTSANRGNSSMRSTGLEFSTLDLDFQLPASRDPQVGKLKVSRGQSHKSSPRTPDLDLPSPGPRDPQVSKLKPHRGQSHTSSPRTPDLDYQVLAPREPQVGKLKLPRGQFPSNSSSNSPKPSSDTPQTGSCRAANGYALALAEQANSMGCLEAVNKDMEHLAKLLENEELHEFLTSPDIADTKKKNILRTVAEDVGFHQYTATFANALVEKKRIVIVKEVVREFEKIYNHLTDTQVATVTSATKMSARELAVVAKKIKSLSGASKIRVKNVVDQSLIAGYVMGYEDAEGYKFIDMSVKGQVDRLAP